MNMYIIMKIDLIYYNYIINIFQKYRVSYRLNIDISIYELWFLLKRWMRIYQILCVDFYEGWL